MAPSIRTLREADERLRAAAFDLSPTPSFIVGRDGSVAAVNEASEALFGRAISALTRRRLADAFPPDAVLPKMAQRAARDGVTLHERGLEISLPDIKPIEADAVAAPLSEGMAVVCLQVKAPEADLERTQGTLRSVAGMGRTLAHEVKNPLAGIRGAAQLLRSGATASAEDAALAQLIVDETDRIRRLIDRVEAFAEDRPSERRPVNIHRVLDRVRALMTVGGGEEIVFREQFDPSLPHVVGDEDQLIQIFLNLAKNAVEAARLRGDGRGEVLIATAFRHGRRTAPLEIRVQDNGPGVGGDLRHRLFDPFVTTKVHGAGLGLTLVAKLVASHQGTVDFESEPGRTVFRVLLPITLKDLNAG